MVYSNVIFGCLSIALTEGESVSEGIDLMNALNMGDHLVYFCKHLDVVWELVLKNELSNSVIGGNYDLLVFSHVAMILGYKKEALMLADISYSKELEGFGSKILNLYAEYYHSILNNKPIKASNIVTKRGLESYWGDYLVLMEKISLNEDISEIREYIAERLVDRNSSKLIKDDWYEIEGSHLHNVQWDFRLAAFDEFLNNKH